VIGVFFTKENYSHLNDSDEKEILFK